MEEFFSNRNSAPFDGRIANLNLSVLNHIKSEDISFAVGKGRFSEQFEGSVLVSQKPLPVLNVRTVLKVMKNDGYAKKSFLNEQRAGTLRHPAIQPVFATYEDSVQLCVLSAFSEFGDLEDLVKQDEQKRPVLLQPCVRLRVLIQISSAILYINKLGFTHNDIKLANIVVDHCLNARLIDFGLYQKCDAVFDEMSGTPCYLPNEINEETRTEALMFYSFAVVILALLTGESPESSNVHGHYSVECNRPIAQLKDEFGKGANCQCYIEKNSQGLKWTPKQFSSQVDIAMKCLMSIRKDKQAIDFHKDIHQELIAVGRCHFSDFEFYSKVVCKPGLLTDTNPQTHIKPDSCENCIINPIMKTQAFKHIEHSDCKRNVQLCRECVKSHYLNPIICPSCGECRPKVDGVSTALVCLAGDGIGQYTEQERNVFKNDIQQIANTFTERLPSVQTQCVYKAEDFKKECNTVCEDKSKLTVVLFYSGHYDKGNRRLHLLDNKYLTKDQLSSCVNKLVKLKSKVVLFLDCCGAPCVLNLSDGSDAQGNSNQAQAHCDFIQVNATLENQEADASRTEGSLFTKYIVQALDPRKQCKDCRICDEYFSNDEKDYDTINKIVKYVQRHYNDKDNKLQVRLIKDNTLGSEKFVFSAKTNITIYIKIMKPESDVTDSIKVGYFSPFNEIARKIFSKYFNLQSEKMSDYDDQIQSAIEVEDEITNEKISSEEELVKAWNSKHNIRASLHKTCQIPLSRGVIFFQKVSPNDGTQCSAPQSHLLTSCRMCKRYVGVRSTKIKPLRFKTKYIHTRCRHFKSNLTRRIVMFVRRHVVKRMQTPGTVQTPAIHKIIHIPNMSLIILNENVKLNIPQYTTPLKQSSVTPVKERLIYSRS